MGALHSMRQAYDSSYARNYWLVFAIATLVVLRNSLHDLRLPFASGSPFLPKRIASSSQQSLPLTSLPY